MTRPTISLCTILTVLFIALKVSGVITWPWWVVLVPLWGPLAVALAFIILVLLGGAVIGAITLGAIVILAALD